MRRDRLLPYLLLLPSLVFLLVFFAIPLVEAVELAFFTPEAGWGLENFKIMAEDLNFNEAVKNTSLLLVIVVPCQLALALGLGQLLTRLQGAREGFLYVWTIPLAISDLGAGILWLAILSERGYFNTILMALGLVDGPVSWLTYETPTALLLCVVVAEIWRATAIVLVIIVAGMQLIPKEYGEAAEVFGASPWQRFLKVTLPSLKPSIQTALILRTILAFEVFAVVVALGGTNLPVLVGEAYNWQNQYQNSGVASAYAVIVLGVSLLATIVYLQVLKVRQETLV